MSNARPERIELKTPTKYADDFNSILSKELMPAAKLERVDTETETVFSFSPTKGEYFIISISVKIYCEQKRIQASCSGRDNLSNKKEQAFQKTSKT